MVVVERDNWKLVLLDGKYTVKLKCPDCGVWAYADGHTVFEDGRLDPSVVCSGKDGCKFHDFVKFRRGNYV